MGYITDAELKDKAGAILARLAEEVALPEVKIAENALRMEHDDLGLVATIGEAKHQSWSRGGTGKLFITVGEHGSRTTYPERKNGSFHPDLAKKIRSYIYRELAARRNRVEKAEAKRRTTDALKGLGYESIWFTVRGANKIQLRFEFSLGELEVLAPILREMDLIGEAS